MKTIPAIHRHISLKSFNTFGIDVKAQYFTEIYSVENLQHLLNTETAKSQAHFILGGGSNVLFTQDVKGLVIRVLISGMQVLREDDQHVWLQVGAGENWHQFVMHCVQQNWGGIENLSLIPGTVGAAPIQNIGAYGVELKDVFVELQALCINDGSLHTFRHHDCQFGYRNSIFKNSHKNQFIICSITLKLNKIPQFNISYGIVAQTLKKLGHETVTTRAVSEAIMQIRREKLPDPQEIGNAGSFFKNPEISQQEFLTLQNAYPEMPHFLLDDQQVKIPAGWLIEQCGWKGKRSGDKGTYDKQALVIVNYGAATGNEIKQFAEEIQKSVYEKFGIKLTPEVNII